MPAAQQILLLVVVVAVLLLTLAVPCWPWIERALLRWLAYWHGVGEPTQAQFYRCHGCQHLVTHAMIALGGCACHMGRNRISPTTVRLREKARLLMLPWTVR